MNKLAFRICTAFFILGIISRGGSAAEHARFSHWPTSLQLHCLDTLLSGREPSEIGELKAAAQVATAMFGENGRTQYIYWLQSPEFCMGNNCLMIIGELDNSDTCHQISFDFTSNGVFTLLKQRDYGYLRFDSPCEWRFDGHKFQLVRNDCRTPTDYHPPGGSGNLFFSKQLTRDQRRCLDQLLTDPDSAVGRDGKDELEGTAQAATAMLSDNHRTQYIYYFEASGYCGSAGCRMMIAEVGRDRCHLLYDYDSDGTFTVLRERDHSYHRFWSPCEARFDGHQYELLHETCRNLEVYH